MRSPTSFPATTSGDRVARVAAAAHTWVVPARSLGAGCGTNCSLETRRLGPVPLDAPRPVGMARRHLESATPRRSWNRTSSRTSRRAASSGLDTSPRRPTDVLRRAFGPRGSRTIGGRWPRCLPRRPAPTRRLSSWNMDGQSRTRVASATMVDAQPVSRDLDRRSHPWPLFLSPRLERMAFRMRSALGRSPRPRIPSSASLRSLGTLRSLAPSAPVSLRLDASEDLTPARACCFQNLSAPGVAERCSLSN